MSTENIYAGWKPEVVKQFKSWQMRTIVVSMIGYAIYYFVRKNFSIAMPGLTAQYGISNTSFGIVIGVGSLIYGLSRFVNGFIVDRFSARVIMAIGLLLCAAKAEVKGRVPVVVLPGVAGKRGQHSEAEQTHDDQHRTQYAEKGLAFFHSNTSFYFLNRIECGWPGHIHLSATNYSTLTYKCQCYILTRRN